MDEASSTQQDKLRDDAILANIGQGLIAIDKLGKIVTFNKAAESILQWTVQESLGKNLADIFRIDYEDSIKISKKTPQGQTSFLYVFRKDTTKFPAAITTTSYVQGDEILGTITLFRDITEEVNMDAMKNDFISLASHQLRTPLAAIKWYSHMLLNGDAGKLLPDQVQYADSIYTSTERMIGLVNSLLNITRIESGRIIVNPKPTDLEKMVAELVEEVKIRFAEKKQKFTIVKNGTIPVVSVDPNLIRQVYLNLLTNAAKYTQENGEITITFSLKDADIISEVKDNGSGIPEKDQKKVFDKFYRGENIVNNGTDGTGLGLYLVKDLVELSKGKIWFTSEEGKGTIFYLSLPTAGTPAKKGVLTLEA